MSINSVTVWPSSGRRQKQIKVWWQHLWLLTEYYTVSTLASFRERSWWMTFFNSVSFYFYSINQSGYMTFPNSSIFSAKNMWTTLGWQRATSKLYVACRYISESAGTSSAASKISHKSLNKCSDFHIRHPLLGHFWRFFVLFCLILLDFFNFTFFVLIRDRYRRILFPRVKFFAMVKNI